MLFGDKPDRLLWTVSEGAEPATTTRLDLRDK